MFITRNNIFAAGNRNRPKTPADTNIYMLDAEGNRVKDSYGNDIIIPH